MPQRFTVETVHGEGASVHHVIDAEAPHDEQPAIIATFRERAAAIASANARERAAAETIKAPGVPGWVVWTETNDANDPEIHDHVFLNEDDAKDAARDLCEQYADLGFVLWYDWRRPPEDDGDNYNDDWTATVHVDEVMIW